MPTRNYRQAKRARETIRKSRQQQKLERKQNRATTPATSEDPVPAETGKGQEDVP